MIGSRAAIIQRIVSDRTGLVAGPPILSVAGLAKQAATLYDNLSRLQYDTSSASTANFRAIGWDWRNGIDDPAVQLAIAGAIDAFGRNVTMIVHSTGGLVFRAFLESNPAYGAKINRVLAFAVPWIGTLSAFEAITRGVSERFMGVVGFSASEVQEMTRTCQAAYDLCPPDPSETDMGSVVMFTDNGSAVGPLVTPSDWTSDPAMQALASNAHVRFGVRSRSIAGAPPITTISGWGASTLASCSVTNGQVAFREDKGGDGTVPFVSSTWLTGTSSFFVPVGAYERNAVPELHPHIWDSPPVFDLLSGLLGASQPRPFIAAAVDGDDNFPSVDPVRIRIAALDANGAALPNARITLRLPPANPSWPIVQRLEIQLARAGLPDNANGNARIEVDVDWNGGSAKTAIAIRVV